MRARTPEKDFVVFDYDGTIAEEGGKIAPSIFLGVEALRHAGITTSVITARPFQRLSAVCGDVENVNKRGATIQKAIMKLKREVL